MKGVPKLLLRVGTPSIRSGLPPRLLRDDCRGSFPHLEVGVGVLLFVSLMEGVVIVGRQTGTPRLRRASVVVSLDAMTMLVLHFELGISRVQVFAPWLSTRNVMQVM